LRPVARASVEGSLVSIGVYSPNDIFTTIVQTSKLHGLSAYAYFRDRLGHRFDLPSLASVIRTACQATAHQAG
jgi:hypothetical protein